jgi:stringent starvation protein B
VTAVTPKRPYLLRAMHEWMVDNNLTPHIVIDATMAGVNVPAQHVKDGKIILNISYSATEGLDLGGDTIAFNTRFGGVSHYVEAPVAAVLGIYAQQTGQGMIFTDEEISDPVDDDPEQPPRKRPELKIIK